MILHFLERLRTVATIYRLIMIGACGLAACDAPRSTAPAPSAKSTSVVFVLEPWAAATPSGARVGAGYMRIINPTEVDDRLVNIGSSHAARVEMQEVQTDGGMMRTRDVKGGILVPALGIVELAPGGYQLSFIDIPDPFLEGETILIGLQFERAGAMEAYLPVRLVEAGSNGSP